MQASRLNLLSKEKRHHLQQMVYVQFSKYMLEIILFIIAIFGVALIGSEYILESYFQSIRTPVNANIQHLESINGTVHFINTTIQKTHLMENEHVYWTHLLSEFANHTPDTITIRSIHIQKSTNTFQIDGDATNRDALLTYQQSLESLEWIENASIPISQLTEKESFPFSISATIK